MTRVSRSVTLRGAVGADLRTGRYLDAEYLIVPLVALVEGVIRPANAESPELVLAAEFEKAPGGWNGRPVVLNHPQRGDAYVSAGDPAVLEEYAFGMLFNTRVEDKKLLTEAWLSVARAEAVGPKAVRVMEMVRAGEMVEVSTGTLVEVEPTAGIYAPTAQEYGGVWRGIVPDHLAMLEEGSIGACSVEMGCGAPRAAVAYQVTATGLAALVAEQEDKTMPDNPAAGTPTPAVPAKTPPVPAADPSRSLRDRLLSLVGIKPKGEGEPATLREDVSRAMAQALREGAAEDTTDVDLRNALDRALRSTEPGYLWIEAVIPAKGQVVYLVAPEDRMMTIRRPFTVADDGTVGLADGREEVKAVTHYEPIKAASAGDCGCHATSKTPASAAAGDQTMPEIKKARVQALIDSKRNPYTAAQSAALEALDETALKAIEDIDASLPEPKVEETKAEPKVETKVEPAAAKAKTAEEVEAEYLATAPASIRTMVAEKKAADAAEKAALVTGLKAAQTQFSEAQLNAKPNDELRAMAAMLEAASGQAVVSYEGRALPRPAGEPTNEPPDGYAIAIAARQAATPKGKES